MSDTIDSGDMELALAEIRFRPDFVVVHSRQVNGVTIQKRTPRLSYWKAVMWCRLLRSVESDIDVQIHGAHAQVLKLEKLKVLPVNV